MQQPHTNAAIHQILSIQQFKAKPQDIKELYPRGYALPQFFLNNLVSKERVVKQFSGKLALVQAFYFQFMRLALEIQNKEGKYRSILMEMFVQYDVFCQGQLEDAIFTDFQYRKFFKDFIEVVQKDKFPNFQQKAQQYPIIDQILKKLFKMVVPIPLLANLQSQKQSPKTSAQKLLQFLCQLFNITLIQSGPCFKFQQSDTFIYFQQTDQIYLAYNDETMEVTSQEYTQSNFKCGEDNSFVTKYHTANSDDSGRNKAFQKSKYYRTQQSQTIQQEQKQQKDTPLLDLRHISCISKTSDNSKRAATERQKEEVFSPVIGRMTPGFTTLFSSPPPIPQQKQNKQLYTQFTNTFILEQVSPKSRDTIKTIKQKYRERTSIPHRF